MRNYIEKIVLILIGAGIALLFVKPCNDPISGDVVYIPGDSVPYVVYKDVPKPYKIVKTDSLLIHDTIWMPGDTSYVVVPVDTSAILSDYFAKVHYKDTVKNDSSALIVLNETVFKNRISHRKVVFQNRRSTAIIEERKRAFVLGVGSNMSGVDVSIGYRQGRNVINATYSNQGLGLRYQREIGWKSRSEK